MLIFQSVKHQVCAGNRLSLYPFSTIFVRNFRATQIWVALFWRSILKRLNFTLTIRAVCLALTFSAFTKAAQLTQHQPQDITLVQLCLIAASKQLKKIVEMEKEHNVPITQEYLDKVPSDLYSDLGKEFFYTYGEFFSPPNIPNAKEFNNWKKSKEELRKHADLCAFIKAVQEHFTTRPINLSLVSFLNGHNWPTLKLDDSTSMLLHIRQTRLPNSLRILQGTSLTEELKQRVNFCVSIATLQKFIREDDVKCSVFPDTLNDGILEWSELSQKTDIPPLRISCIGQVIFPKTTEILWLMNSKLTSLTGTIFPESIITLNLSNNELACFPETLPASLIRLNLSYNQLADFGEIVLPLSLEKLDVSSNKIRTVPCGIVQQLQKLPLLNEFNIQFNQIDGEEEQKLSIDLGSKALVAQRPPIIVDGLFLE